MSTTWLIVTAVGAATVVLKGAGTLALGARALPTRAHALIALLPPSLLAALVVVQAVGADRAVSADGRLAGLAAAAIALALRASVLVVLTAAAVVAAAARSLGAV